MNFIFTERIIFMKTAFSTPQTGTFSPIMVQPKDIVTMFSISRSTVTRLIGKMLLDDKYKSCVTRLNRNLVLIDVQMFTDYLKEQDLKGLKA